MRTRYHYPNLKMQLMQVWSLTRPDRVTTAPSSYQNGLTIVGLDLQKGGCGVTWTRTYLFSYVMMMLFELCPPTCMNVCLLRMLEKYTLIWPTKWEPRVELSGAIENPWRNRERYTMHQLNLHVFMWQSTLICDQIWENPTYAIFSVNRIWCMVGKT